MHPRDSVGALPQRPADDCPARVEHGPPTRPVCLANLWCGGITASGRGRRGGGCEADNGGGGRVVPGPPGDGEIQTLDTYGAKQGTPHHHHPCVREFTPRSHTQGGLPAFEAWSSFVSHLHDFICREGHACVPRAYVCYDDGYPLGQTVANVRTLKTFVKNAPGRVSILDTVGFVWDKEDEKWERFLVELRRFELREGHCRVERGHVTPSGFRLGAAMSNVRERFDFYAHPDRQAEYEALDADFASVYSNDEGKAKWHEFLEAFTAFRDREGHARVPQNHREAGYALGRNVNNMRSLGYFLSDEPERLRMMLDMGFVFYARSEAENQRRRSFLHHRVEAGLGWAKVPGKESWPGPADAEAGWKSTPGFVAWS